MRQDEKLLTIRELGVNIGRGQQLPIILSRGGQVRPGRIAAPRNQPDPSILELSQKNATIERIFAKFIQ